jgi:hypothetical protein
MVSQLDATIGMILCFLIGGLGGWAITLRIQDIKRIAKRKHIKWWQV